MTLRQKFMRRKSLVTSREGDTFEIVFNPLTKKLIVKCVNVHGLAFRSAIEELMKNSGLKILEDDGIMDITYKCESYDEYQKCLSKI